MNNITNKKPINDLKQTMKHTNNKLTDTTNTNKI